MMKQFLKYTFLTIILGVFWGEAESQHNIGNLMVSNKFRGDQYFLDLYYEKAIDYYKLALKKGQNKEDLKLKMEELEQFSKLAIGRELKMIQLKQEINELRVRLGHEAKYEIVE